MVRQPLYFENVTSQGNIEMSDTMAVPPAMATTNEGSAQQINVPVDVKNARKLLKLCCQLFVD